MNESDKKKLRIYYNSLLAQKQVIDKPSGKVDIRGISLYPIVHELQLLQKEFPEMVPFELPSSTRFDNKTYSIVNISNRLSMVLARLEGELNEYQNSFAIDTKEFSFINNSDVCLPFLVSSTFLLFSIPESLSHFSQASCS